MNKTLTSLRIAGSGIGRLVNPVRSLPSFTSISNFRISHSFSTFLSEKNTFGSLSVSKSAFTRFLDHAVLVDSDYDITSAHLTEHRTVYGHKMDILILDTSFVHCTTTTSHGGAILFDRKTLSVRIDRVYFGKCSTKKSGGAFYAIMDNMTVTRTCFEECQAIESGHAFFVNLNTKLYTANYSEATIIKCSTNAKLTGKSAGLFLAGIYRAQLVNCSENYALALCAAFGSLSSTNFTVTFNEFINCSSMNIFRFLDLNQSLVFAFSNFVDNKATVSLMQSSSRNNILNSVFIRNEVPAICTGLVSYLQMSDCVMDYSYSFAGLAYLRTPGMVITKEAEPLLIRFAYQGQCRILGEREGLGGQDAIKQILQQIPQNNLKYIQLFAERMSFEPPIPTPRSIVKTEEPEENNPAQQQPASYQPRRAHGADPSSRTKGRIIVAPEYEDPLTRKRDRSSGRSSHHGVVTPFVGGGRRNHDTNSKNILPQVFTPSASFSPSETFFKSRTFLPSLQFTASISPAQTLVPYVLYSAAGFVVFAVLTSFLFLKSSDAGYNLMTPSESADSRISDYASSTSTTVTMTGESSSVVV